MKSCNRELLASFWDYCCDHPEERFWQALRNWSGHTYVLTARTHEFHGAIDTFYREEK